jgi:hypothetical protein
MSLHDKIMNLPCRVPDNRANSGVACYQQGHRDARHAAAELALTADALLEALQRIMPSPLTGNPSHAELVAFWTSEKEQGRGEADDVLFALAAILAATGGGE